MKIKATKTLVGEYGRLEKGSVIDLPSWQAKPLLALGYVQLVDDTPAVVDPVTQPVRRGRRKKNVASDA